MYQEAERWPALLSLCFFSTLFILASNSEALFLSGTGGMFSILLFLLGGFFAAGGRREEDFLSPSGWLSFYLMCLKEILLPTWVICLFFFYLGDSLLSDKWSLFDNLLFLRSSAHLWLVQQTLFACLFYPLLGALLALLKRALERTRCSGDTTEILLGIALIAFTLCLALYLLHASSFGLPWYGGKRPFTGIFFYMGAGLFHLARPYLNRPLFLKKIASKALDLVGFLLLCIVPFLLSDSLLQGSLGKLLSLPENISFSRDYSLCSALLMGVLLLLPLLHGRGEFARFLRWKETARLGKAGLYAYLLHYFLLLRLSESHAKAFLLTALLTYPLALFLAEILMPSLEKGVILLLDKARTWMKKGIRIGRG